MKPAMPRTCSLCGQEVLGVLGMTMHRRRRHGLRHGSTAHAAELSALPPPPSKRLARYRAAWKKEQAKVRQIRSDVHERFMAIMGRVG